MKAAWCIVAVGVLAVCANASVDFFFSSSADPYGLRVPALAMLYGISCTSFQDGYELMPAGGPYAVPPYGEPGTMPDVELRCGEPTWAYIWARFNNEPPAAEVGAMNGIGIKINGAASGQGNIAYYKLCNLDDPNIGKMRWDGSPEIFYGNPTGLIAIYADGIRNEPSDVPWNLFVGGDHHVFLLGAVKCDICPSELTIEVGAMNYSGTTTNPAPPPPTPRYLNKVICIPEPASVMLLVLAGMLLRRR